MQLMKGVSKTCSLFTLLAILKVAMCIISKQQGEGISEVTLQTLVNEVNSPEEQEMNIFNVLETIQARMGEDSAKLGDHEKSLLSMVCLCVG